MIQLRSNVFVTNIIFVQFLGTVEHQTLTAGLSGDDNHGYCLSIGPMLVSGGNGTDKKVCTLRTPGALL